MNRRYLWLQHRPTVTDVIIATPIGLLALVISGPDSPGRVERRGAYEHELVRASG